LSTGFALVCAEKTVKKERFFDDLLFLLNLGAFFAASRKKPGFAGLRVFALRPRHMATCGGPAPWLNPYNPLRTNRQHRSHP
jgi:hypothetical protein